MRKSVATVTGILRLEDYQTLEALLLKSEDAGLGGNPYYEIRARLTISKQTAKEIKWGAIVKAYAEKPPTQPASLAIRDISKRFSISERQAWRIISGCHLLTDP